jgi:hypothetical protein
VYKMSKRRITKGQGGGGGANFNDSKKLISKNSYL